MVRLYCESGGYYWLKDTETKDYLARCQVTGRRDILEIWSVHVFEEFRRMGYATMMLKRVINKYLNDSRPLRLYVYKDNTVAIHLYEKLGFEIIGEYGSNAWTMQYKPNM